MACDRLGVRAGHGDDGLVERVVRDARALHSRICHRQQRLDGGSGPDGVLVARSAVREMKSVALQIEDRCERLGGATVDPQQIASAGPGRR